MGKSSARLPGKQYLRHIILILCFVTFVLCRSIPVYADFSGLVIIPTADIVGDGQFNIVSEINGPNPGTSTNAYILNTQFGIGDRLEAGIDFGLSSNNASFAALNVKYLVPTITRGRRAFAIGTFNLDQNMETSPYMVLTQNFGLMRGHLGALRSEGDNDWFVGLDSGHTLSHYILMADYTSGSANFSSVGVFCQFNKYSGLQFGAQFPNAGGETVLNIQLFFAGHYK